MAQNVGDIEYTIKADTAELLTAGKDVNRVTGRMESDLSKADKAADRLSTGLNKSRSCNCRGFYHSGRPKNHRNCR